MKETMLANLQRITRLALMAYAIVQFVLLAAGILLYPGYAARHAAEFTPNAFWTFEQTQAAVAELNWPGMALPWVLISADLAVALLSMSFGLFVLWRKSDTWFGVYLSFVFLGLAGGTFIEPVLEWLPALTGPAEFMGTIGWQLMFILFYLFPDGHFVPRWTHWMPFAWLGVNLAPWVSGDSVLSLPGWGIWIGMGLAATAVGSQVYRYFWRATPLERQQSKWVVMAFTALLGFLLIVGPTTFRAPASDGLGQAMQRALFFGTLFRLSFLVLPAGILVAILRYRLWDIDVLIRRTLIYSVLTVVLALAYFGTVLVLESLFRGITGQGQNSLVVVLSTLAIAALFGPLRSRVQAWIDRRFYRRKYDAAWTLAGFAASARDETDLAQLSTRLVDVVEETMQPAHVDLWLRKAP